MKKKRLGFCTTVRDRFNSLVITLPENISNIPEGCCICVVDYASKSCAGEHWMLNNYSNEIMLGKLIVFRVTNDIDWSAPKAKNLAHRLVNAEYMVNLDCDNFISELDVKDFLCMAERNIPCQQFCSQFPGSYGRIGIPSDTFYAIGGYDEGMLPMGYQDADLLFRATSYHRSCAQIDWNNSHPPVDIQKPKLHAYGRDNKFFESINAFNRQRCFLRKRLAGILIKDSFASYRGRLNGEEVVLDGFGSMTKI